MSHRLHTTAPRLTAAATWQPESGTPATNTAPANGFPPPCPKTGTRHTTSFVFDSYIPLFWVNQQRILPAPHPLLIEEPACISIRPCKPVRPPYYPTPIPPPTNMPALEHLLLPCFFLLFVHIPFAIHTIFGILVQERSGNLFEENSFHVCLPYGVKARPERTHALHPHIPVLPRT